MLWIQHECSAFELKLLQFTENNCECVDLSLLLSRFYSSRLSASSIDPVHPVHPVHPININPITVDTIENVENLKNLENSIAHLPFTSSDSSPKEDVLSDFMNLYGEMLANLPDVCTEDFSRMDEFYEKIKSHNVL